MARYSDVYGLLVVDCVVNPTDDYFLLVVFLRLLQELDFMERVWSQVVAEGLFVGRCFCLSTIVVYGFAGVLLTLYV